MALLADLRSRNRSRQDSDDFLVVLIADILSLRLFLSWTFLFYILFNFLINLDIFPLLRLALGLRPDILVLGLELLLVGLDLIGLLLVLAKICFLFNQLQNLARS